MRNSTTQWHEIPVAANIPYDAIFAIGDVHGDKMKLAEHHRNIDNLSEKDNHVAVVHIGDMIDHGEKRDTDAKEALLMALYYSKPGKHVLLPGNHEALLLDSVVKKDLRVARYWITTGSGHTTLKSLGVMAKDTNPEYICSEEKTPELIKILYQTELLLQKEIDILKNLPAGWEAGNLVFLHAGVPNGLNPSDVIDYPWYENGNPKNRELAQASPLWVRHSFLKREEPYSDGKIVVHGHTILKTPEITKTRISIDTGSYLPGNPLTMAEFRGNKVRFHMVYDD